MRSSIIYITNYLKKFDIDLNSDITEEPKKPDGFGSTEKILSVYKYSGGYNLTLTNLGIKYTKNSPIIFNSRIETIKKKQHWMTLFETNRMLVPMSGFYEWKIEGSQKIPYRIFIPGEELFFVGSVYHQDNDKNIFSSLITTTPNSFVKKIHHRMPVILKISEGIKFLNCDSATALEMCIPFQGEMAMEKVQ